MLNHRTRLHSVVNVRELLPRLNMSAGGRLSRWERARMKCGRQGISRPLTPTLSQMERELGLVFFSADPGVRQLSIQ
jgi:hypothetical protein